MHIYQKKWLGGFILGFLTGISAVYIVAQFYVQNLSNSVQHKSDEWCEVYHSHRLLTEQCYRKIKSSLWSNGDNKNKREKQCQY